MIALLLIPALSILNRMRGGWFDLPIWPIGVAFGILSWMLTHDPAAFVYGMALYLTGESFGWGKWIGSIGARTPKYNENEGTRNGIHWIANRIISERSDYMGYSRIALAIRGVYWFAPLMILYGIYGSIGWVEAAVLSLLTGAAFPLSVEMGRRILYHRFWETAELVYGAFHGLLFAWLLA